MNRLAFFVLSVLLVSSTVVFSQNLVPNPGFEKYAVCPGNYTRGVKEFRVNDWYPASAGTPDHFHICSIGEADVPHNWAGVSDAYEGNGYSGIYTWMSIDKDYREYLQCKLTEPLRKDSTYIVSFRFKLSSYSKYAADRMGILLTEKAEKMHHDRAWRITPTLQLILDSALTPATGYWESANFEYKARGGEHYITLGNFADNASTNHYRIRHRIIQQEMLAHSAYYYIDEVIVSSKYRHLPDSIRIQDTPAFATEAVQLDKRYILNDIRFAFNSYKLVSSSFEQLDKVVMYLEMNPYHKVQLLGHTDDVGSEQYNLTLSRNRANAVAAYLISRGIPASRVETYGYGKEQPLVAGDTEEIRSINRRVEVKFFR